MADALPNPDSGAAGTEYQTIAALRSLGHHVDEVWGDELSQRVRHGNLHYLLELPIVYRSAMLARLRETSYDVVHVNQPHGYLAAKHLRLSGRKAVFVHRSHGFEGRVNAVLRPWQARYGGSRPPLPKRVATRIMERLLEINNRSIAKYADGHIVSASLCASYMTSHYHVEAKRIATIAQAAPTLFREQPIAAFDTERLNRLLYIGQFAFIKAPMMVAKIFESVLEKRPEVTLTWVCDAKHHQDAASLLSPQARERTRFMDWSSQQSLIDLYDRHGIFLFPSFFEGFGKAFLEAMVRGLIVVASDEGGAHDLIENNVNGCVAAVGDVAQFAACCLQVQSNPARAGELSAAARQTALQYSWSRVAVETANFYKRVYRMKNGASLDA